MRVCTMLMPWSVLRRGAEDVAPYKALAQFLDGTRGENAICRCNEAEAKRIVVHC